MKLEQIEGYDKLIDGVYLFWLDISDLPEAVQAEAREIAKEDYDPKCFGVDVGYEPDSNSFYLVTDWDGPDEPRAIYYVDRDGDKHWFPCEIPLEFQAQIFAECNKALSQEKEAQKPSVRDALQRTASESKVHEHPPTKKDRGKDAR